MMVGWGEVVGVSQQQQQQDERGTGLTSIRGGARGVTVHGRR